jgi:hypothetical protein
MWKVEIVLVHTCIPWRCGMVMHDIWFRVHISGIES